MKINKFTTLVITSFLLAACSNPQPGPDKTVTGAILGAGWGAGAGAVIGNQIADTPTGEGAAVGAGFGLVSGMLSGAGHDLTEGTQLEHERQLAALKVQNITNQRQLAQLQSTLDNTVATDNAGGIYQVFFDTDQTNLRAGALANLEVIAEAIKASPAARSVFVVGHTDDTGNPKYNQRLAEARARSVSAYLMSRGISADSINVTNHGSKRPIASNASDTGRQLNRRVDVYIGD